MHVYLCSMATATKPRKRATSVKLTLTPSVDHVAMAKRASRRRGKSITKMFEEFVETLDTEVMAGKQLWVDEVRNHNAGFTDADYGRADLLGALLRKHMPKR